MNKEEQKRLIIEIMEADRNDNRRLFYTLEPHWLTVRAGYLRNLEPEVKSLIERIYREEIDQNWIPNRYCKGCYFEAIERLIKFYEG